MNIDPQQRSARWWSVGTLINGIVVVVSAVTGAWIVAAIASFFLVICLVGLVGALRRERSGQ